MAKPLSKPQQEMLADDAPCEWKGASGKSYTYYITSISNTFNNRPGNYIYAMRNPKSGGWKALYIGQTASLSRRPEGNYEWERAAVRNGATHVHAHVSSDDESVRRQEQEDLIQSLRPPLNEDSSLA